MFGIVLAMGIINMFNMSYLLSTSHQEFVRIIHVLYTFLFSSMSIKICV